MAGSTVKMIALLAATSFAASSPAAAAVQAQAAPTALISPWVALSAFSSTGSGASLCASAATAAAAGQAGNPGCVLPQIDAPVAAPLAEAAPVPVATVPAATGGLSFLPILLGLAAVAAGVALLAGKGGNNDNVNLPPITPS